MLLTQVACSYVPFSVLTRIYRLKGTNNICDPAPHLECSDSQYQTLVACVPLSTKDSKFSSMFTEFYSQSPDIVGFGADSEGTLEPPKGTVPFGKGLARTLVPLLHTNVIPFQLPFFIKQFTSCSILVVYMNYVPYVCTMA